MQIHSYEKYGGMGYPSYQHSFTALFIILCGRYIKNNYFCTQKEKKFKKYEKEEKLFNI